MLEGLARDERHRIVDEIPALAGREKGDDVGVLKLRGDLDLATEPAAVHVRDQLRRQKLDDDLSSQYAVSCHEHATHPSSAELALDVVGLGEDVL